MGGKRFADPEDSQDFGGVNFKKIIIIVLIIAVIIAIVAGVIYFAKNRKKPEPEPDNTDVVVDDGKMAKTYEGYNVLGQIVIEKIDLKEYILDSTESGAMDKAPVKLYGETLNQEGNFCIAGHNYEEIFANLEKLKVGDEFYIEDIDGVIQDYEIKEISEVEPTDLTPLMPVTDKIQVTLVTCKKDSTKRVIIKAERVSIEDQPVEEQEESEDTNTTKE